MPLTASELQAHPAWKAGLQWNLPPTSEGRCKVAKNRSGGPLDLYYEVHGTGPTKIVWIMGLGAYSTAWKRQTKYFGHSNASQYSNLIFDNRGVGKSDKPLSRYSTTEMAKDIIDLLAFLKWLDPESSQPTRTVNILGVSMGGMIAQELALLIPRWINALFLVSTCPRLVRSVPFWQNIQERAAMFLPKDVDVQLDEIAGRLMHDAFRTLPDTEMTDGRPNFPTNQDRYSAGELAKRQDTEGFTKKGFILQMIAAGWHHMDAKKLKRLGDEVGRDRIMIIHGTVDKMITFSPHVQIFRDELKPGKVKVYEGKAHLLPWEEEDDFNRTIAEFVQECETMSN